MNCHEVISPIISPITIIYLLGYFALIYLATKLLFDEFELGRSLYCALIIFILIFLSITPQEIQYENYSEEELKLILEDRMGRGLEWEIEDYKTYSRNELIESLSYNRLQERFVLEFFNKELSKKQRERDMFYALLCFLKYLVPAYVILFLFGVTVKRR